MTETPQKLKLEKVCGTLIISFYVSPFLLWVLLSCNHVLKRIIRYHLKILPLKELLQFQERIFFLIKTQITTSLLQVTCGIIENLVLNKMLELFPKIPPLKKILELQDWKKTAKKRKFQTRNWTNDWKLTTWTLSIRKKTSKAC